MGPPAQQTEEPVASISRNRANGGVPTLWRSILACMAAVLLLLLGSLGWVQAASPHMAIHLRAPSGPHTIAVGKTVTLHLTVSGIHLDAQHIGKRAWDHQGHIQLYVDRIPRNAYTRPSLQHWLASVGATTVSLRLSKGIVGTIGRHHIIGALARNDNVLYRVPPAIFTVIVR